MEQPRYTSGKRANSSMKAAGHNHHVTTGAFTKISEDWRLPKRPSKQGRCFQIVACSNSEALYTGKNEHTWINLMSVIFTQKKFQKWKETVLEEFLTKS
jgi:hypothetical protein